ncbi:MAG: molybdopterin-dependent oxidoreductase [Deltaproteobacteria bacterium]|nr:molybdopterin-dependent oxidoreductase [Deltaproteobacteria bacterium]
MPSVDPFDLRFVVNGVEHVLRIPADRLLLDVLREDLGLTGARRGCGQGECGACTVLLDGAPVRSCRVPALRAHGRTIVTVEGLGQPEALSPVQAAFVAEDAVQCGYCTPGMILEASALLGEGGATSREAVRARLAGHLCRCTGYQPIVDAVLRAASGAPPPPPEPDRVGADPARVDAVSKVTGGCRYTADLVWPPGCLHGVTVRARHAHAALRGIRTEAALAVPGVVHVLTWRDVPGTLLWGNAIQDQPVLAKDRVRFWGEAVAVVLAETPEAAREGAERVEVEADPLPPVLDPEQALEAGAPVLHPGGNLLVHLALRKGDAPAETGASPIVIERTYRTPAQAHVCLEPEIALAWPRTKGGTTEITVLAPSQNVFFDRYRIARVLGLPRRAVRVIQPPMGSAFGSREDLYAQHHAALGAWVAGRPVRIAWSREESQVATTKRHPARITCRAGLEADGRIRALEIDVLLDTGAYASWAPNVALKALVHAAGPYAVDHVRVDVRQVYTNHGISGAFRGFGVPQVAFAGESFVDECAEAVGMDPVAFRRRNHLHPGAATATGQVLGASSGLAACLDRALAKAEQVEAALPPPPAGHLRGRGLATIFYGIGYGHGIPDIGSATASLAADGTFEVRCGAVDYGQGALTVFQQIAGEVLGAGRDQVSIRTGDSDETPDSGSTVASRQTYVSGEAVREACQRLEDGLLSIAAAATGRPVERIAVDGRGATEDGTVLLDLCTLAALASTPEGPFERRARVRVSTHPLDAATGQGDPYRTYAWAAHVALVDVEPATGRVKVVGYVAAHDVGRAIHPRMIRGQMAGGVAQGLGFALLEAHRYDASGVPLTRGLDTYRVPRAPDVPEIASVIVEDPDPDGPFGAKGVGEPVILPVAPAIANAVAAATGERIRALPMTPEVVREALGASRVSGGVPHADQGRRLPPPGGANTSLPSPQSAASGKGPAGSSKSGR